MARVAKKQSLELEDEIEFQEREWRVQRIGWVIFAFLLLLALLGLFGQGPLSSAEAVSEDGSTSLKYPRFARYQSEFTLEFDMEKAASSGDEVHLQVSRDYLEKVEIDTIIPNPDSEIETPEWVTYVFKTDGSPSPMVIQFYLSAEEFGLLSGKLRPGNGETVAFPQFVYP